MHRSQLAPEHPLYGQSEKMQQARIYKKNLLNIKLNKSVQTCDALYLLVAAWFCPRARDTI